MDGAAREELDNFLPCSFECSGVTWTSAEHCFQAAKFPHNPAHAERVRNARTGGDAFTIANDRSVPCCPDWERVKVAAMYRANFAKFSQNSELRDALVSSKGPITAFGFPFWAKWNAVILERIREELRPETERDEATLAARIASMEAFAAGWRIDPRPSGFGGTGKACAAAGGVPFPPEMLQSLDKSRAHDGAADSPRAGPAPGAMPPEQSAAQVAMEYLLSALGLRPRQRLCAECGREGGDSGETFCRACGRAFERAHTWREDMRAMVSAS